MELVAYDRDTELLSQSDTNGINCEYMYVGRSMEKTKVSKQNRRSLNTCGIVILCSGLFLSTVFIHYNAMNNAPSRHPRSIVLRCDTDHETQMGHVTKSSSTESASFAQELTFQLNLLCECCASYVCTAFSANLRSFQAEDQPDDCFSFRS